MTTDKNLPKPEHGTIQAQDVHEIEKESEADSTKKQTSFPPSLIAVQTIRTVIEFTLVLPLLPLLSNPLGIILFLPFGLHFILQAVAWSRAKKETRIAWVIGTNLYSLLIVSPYGAICATLFIQLASDSAPGLEGQALPWVLIPPASEAVISIVMIVVMNVIKRNDLRDFQGKRITVAKPRIYDDVLEGSNSGAYETDGGLKPLRNHHDKSDAKVPRQHINVRLQKKD